MANAKKRKRSKKKATPNKEQFMPDVPTDDIKAALKAEQKSGGNAKAVLILLACLWWREGKNGPSIAKDLDRPDSTVYAWLARMHKDGLDARYDKPKPGRRRIIDPKRHEKITDVVDRQPEACGMKSSVWTGRLLLIMIMNVLEVDKISPSTIYRTMHRMVHTQPPPPTR